jgi:hypothetical protein
MAKDGSLVADQYMVRTMVECSKVDVGGGKFICLGDVVTLEDLNKLVVNGAYSVTIAVPESYGK